MNYGEEIAYWYLRLNGFFLLTNFVIHRSTNIKHTSDSDLLALRLPHVYEEIGGKPEDWDKDLADQLGFDHVIGVICQVKTGRYDLKNIFQQQYVQYAIGRLGLVRIDKIAELSKALNDKAIEKTSTDYRICKLLITNKEKVSDSFISISLAHAREFICNRVEKYPYEKYRDRMFFNSVLFQDVIDRIRTEQQKRR